jgi:hypothetical protein
MRSMAIALCLTFVAVSVTAQGTPSAGSEHAVIVQPDQVSYGPVPASLPPGAEVARLEGKPTPAETVAEAAHTVERISEPVHSAGATGR